MVPDVKPGAPADLVRPRSPPIARIGQLPPIGATRGLPRCRHRRCVDGWRTSGCLGRGEV